MFLLGVTLVVVTAFPALFLWRGALGHGEFHRSNVQRATMRKHAQQAMLASITLVFILLTVFDSTGAGIAGVAAQLMLYFFFKELQEMRQPDRNYPAPEDTVADDPWRSLTIRERRRALHLAQRGQRHPDPVVAAIVDDWAAKTLADPLSTKRNARIAAQVKNIGQGS